MTFTKRRNKALVVLFTTLAMSTDSLAEIIQIEFTQFDTYSIEVAHIGVGDTVEWLPKNKGHNVEFLAGPDMADLPPKSNMNEFHSVRFDKQGVYLYGCTPGDDTLHPGPLRHRSSAPRQGRHVADEGISRQNHVQRQLAGGRAE